MGKWQPIESEPATGKFRAYNPSTGWYVTEREGDEFPLRKWDGLDGIWYPRPTHWLPLTDTDT